MRRDDLSIGGGAAALDLSHHLHPFADMKVMLDVFNVFNNNTVLGYSSNNRSASTFTSPSSVLGPRVFRVGVLDTADGFLAGAGLETLCVGLVIDVERFCAVIHPQSVRVRIG